MLLPIAYLVVRATNNGWEGVRDALNRSTLSAIWNTIRLAAVVTTLSALLALPLAWLTVRSDLPGRRLWSVLTMLPLVVPTYVGSFALVSALGPRGEVQGWLEPLGVDRLPDLRGFWGATAALTFFSYPYMLLVVRAALRGLDPALEDAARNLGRGPGRVFFTVVLPQLRPALAAGSLLVALYVLSDFGAVSILQYNTVTRAIFLKYQASFDRTGAAILAVMLVMLAVAILAIEARTRGRIRYHRVGSGVARRARVARLGRWRWPALGFCAMVLFQGLIAPVATLIYWLWQGIANGESLRPVWGAALHSLTASGLAAGLAIAAALPVAILAARYAGILSGTIERASYVGHALPGLVVALALVFFGARYLPPLYQTIWLLVFAYMILFLPQAIGALRASLLQISPNVEHAARGLGRSPFNVVFTVTLPLIRPGIVAGLALVFLTAMKELPATLLLSPTDFPTLATSIWAATSEAFFARAALPSLLLVLLSSALLFVLLGQERSARDV